jgi:hypothetical protein
MNLAIRSGCSKRRTFYKAKTNLQKTRQAERFAHRQNGNDKSQAPYLVLLMRSTIRSNRTGISVFVQSGINKFNVEVVPFKQAQLVSQR